MDFLSNWGFITSSKGWTSDDIGLAWLKEIFIPATKTDMPNEKRLLILDGHGSHATLDFMRICFGNRI